MALRSLLLLSALLLAGIAACQDGYAASDDDATGGAPEEQAPEPGSGLGPPVAGPPLEGPPRAFTLLERTDEGCDGVAEECFWSLYDADGQLLGQRLRRGARCDVAPLTGCTRRWWREDGASMTAQEPSCDGRMTTCRAELTTEQSRLVERDADCDGAPDTRILTAYDADGEVAFERREEQLGTPEARCTYEGVIETADGQRLGRGTDLRCDGIYERCDLNATLGVEAILATPEGAGCAGVVRSCHLIEQREDPRGTWTFTAMDPGCTGELKSCLSVLRDPAGNLLQKELDRFCTGRAEECVTQTLTQDGDRTLGTSFYQQICDTPPTQCRRWIAQGDELLEDEEDRDCDGQPEMCRYATFDAEGRQLTQSNRCGVTEGCSTFTYDASGRLIADVYNPDCTPIPESCSTLRYDDAGNITDNLHDERCDGRPEYCARSTWDPRGPRLTAAQDYGCDGIPEICFEATPLD